MLRAYNKIHECNIKHNFKIQKLYLNKKKFKQVVDFYKFLDGSKMVLLIRTKLYLCIKNVEQ